MKCYISKSICYIRAYCKEKSLQERYPADSTTKQTTNDNITKTNLLSWHLLGYYCKGMNFCSNIHCMMSHVFFYL